MMIIRFMLIVISFSTPLYAASPWGAFSDGVSQGLQNARQIQEMRLMEEQRQAMEQQRIMMEEQQKARREQEQRPTAREIFIAKVRRAHPDFAKYVNDGSIVAWIQRQPETMRDLLMKVYKSGDADSSIALLTQFKKDNNIRTIVE